MSADANSTTTTASAGETVETLLRADFVRDEIRESAKETTPQQGEVLGYWTVTANAAITRQGETTTTPLEADRLSESEQPVLVIHLACPDGTEGYVSFDTRHASTRRSLQCLLSVIGTTGHELSDIVGSAVPMVYRDGWGVPYRTDDSDPAPRYWLTGHGPNRFFTPDYETHRLAPTRWVWGLSASAGVLWVLCVGVFIGFETASHSPFRGVALILFFCLTALGIVGGLYTRAVQRNSYVYFRSVNSFDRA
jgi:hypothetical protein